MAEAAKMAAYQQKLIETTKETFVDKPDEVSRIFIDRSLDTSVDISWEQPCDNNTPITQYKVYLGVLKLQDAKTQAKIVWDLSKVVESISDEPYFEGKIETRCTVTGLQPDSCYYIKVTAVNENGEEGYHAKEPIFVKTMEPKVNNCDGLYVWGYNNRSELGLSDDTIEENKDDFQGQAVTRPIRNPMFDGFTYQVAPGNVSTLFLCVDKQTKYNFLVTCGVCFAPNEGFEDSDINELTQEEV